MDTHDQYLTTFRHWLTSRGRSSNTINAYVSDARQFLLWSGELRPEELEGHVSTYLRNFPMSNATHNRRLASMRVFARAVFGLEILHDNQRTRPVRGFAHPLPEGVDDLRAMLAAAPAHHRPLIAVMGYAGARVEEARGVQRSDIRQDDQGVHWVLLHGKGRADRLVPLPPEAIPHLQLDKDGPLCPLSDRGARYAITRAAERAGVSRHVASHDLRMTFGTEIYNHTKDLRTTQELLGHASSSTTERYTGIRKTAMVDAVTGAFA